METQRITVELSEHLEIAGKCRQPVAMKYLVFLLKRVVTDSSWTAAWGSSREENIPPNLWNKFLRNKRRVNALSLPPRGRNRQI